ncbi:MAG: hypothetical protein EHM57_03400 [Actinobacteria bacterium]|nr:MAG: hypothetical protein EHM57_03400 [Actinomycetota bacterium]
MALRTYPRLERPWLMAMLLIGLAGSPLTGIVGAGAIFALMLPLLIGAFVVVPRFPRLLVSGVVAGVVTGAVVLGGLLRLAMRVVALADGELEPVFTSDTVFIVFIGGFLGLAVGPAVAVMERLWRPRAIYVGLAIGFLGIGMFLLSPDLRSELFELGAGPLLNLPMFTAAFGLFGWTMAIGVGWLQRRLPMTPGRSLAAPVELLEPAVA